MISVNQDEYMRMLNLLEYQAKFILRNSNVDKINQEKETNAETEKNIKEYLYMCNDLDVTFTTYLAAKDKYNIDDNYLEELNKTKKQLNDFVYGNWEVDSLIVDKARLHVSAS